MKHWQHTPETSETLETDAATCAFKHNIYLLLGRKWRLIDAKLDNGVELNATEWLKRPKCLEGE
jgi:hypothetical protein